MLKHFETFCHKIGHIVSFSLHSNHVQEAKDLIAKLQSWVDEITAVAQAVPPIAGEAQAIDRTVDTAAAVAEGALGAISKK